MIKNRHSFFAILIALVGTFDIMFFKGFLSEEMGNFDWSEQAGRVMSIPAFVYLVACLLLPYTCEETSRKFLFLIAMIGFAGCIFLLGPSELLFFPNNVWMLIAS